MEYWVDGVLKHSLHNEVLISLRTREIDKAVDAPWKYTVEVSDAVVSAPLDDRDVSAIYDTTGLLLILGEPGSGKTTTLLGLARTLLDRARDDIKERVPIVANLSSFNKKQPLAEWISGELWEKYRVPPKIARFWLKQNYLLPFLDGLDEVEPSMQPDCVDAINDFIGAFDPPGLIVCCRLSEYQVLPKRLKLNGAIRLEPLSENEIAKYLANGGSELAVLRHAVNKDPVLQELSQTPLMLSIMSLAFQGAVKDELASDKGRTREERRNQIFRLYVEKMLHREGPTAMRRAPPTCWPWKSRTASLDLPMEKIIGWLSWLAGKMREQSQSIFLVEGLQPGWLRTRAERVAYGAAAVLSILVLCGLIIWLIAGLNVWHSAELIVWQSAGLSARQGAVMSAGLSVGLIVGLIVGTGSLNHIALVETVDWKWNQFWKSMIHNSIGLLIGGLTFALIVGLIFGLTANLSAGLRAVLSAMLIAGLSFGLIGGFTDRVKETNDSPNQGIKLSLKNSLAVFLIALLIIGLISGLINGLIFGISGLSGGLSFGLIGGLIGGLIIGLNRGGSAAIKHYALRLILWLNGRAPLNFIQFLDHCARLILLKKVGGGYIFIHRMLRDYFAELPPAPPKA
jgi:hypothetical protein